MSFRSYSHRLTIEQPQDTSGDWVRESDPAVQVGAMYARIKPLRGRELDINRQLHGQVTHKVRTHWMDGIKPSMRLRMGSRVFEIVSAINVGERNRWLEMMVTETDGQA